MESDSGFTLPGNAVLFVHPSSCWYSPHIGEDMGWKVESYMQNGICVGFHGSLACVQVLVALQPQTVEKVMKLTLGTGIMGWATSTVSCNWTSPWVILTIVLWSRYSRCDFRMWGHTKMWLRKSGMWGVPSWCDAVTKLSNVLWVFKLLYHTDSLMSLYTQLPPLQDWIFHSALAGSSIKYSQARPLGSSDCPFI